MAFLHALDFGDGFVECLVPSGFPKTVLRPDERRLKAVRVAVLKVALDAFWTKLAFVDWKFLPRFETNHLVALYLQLNAALHAAEAAMRLYQLVRLAIFPTAGGLVGKRRSVSGDVFFFGEVEEGHGK